jgi:hypothetical protein
MIFMLGGVMLLPIAALARTYMNELFENHSVEEARRISARRAVRSAVEALVLTPILRLLAWSPYSTMGLPGKAGDMMSQAMKAAEPMMAIMLLGFSALNAVCVLICLNSGAPERGEKR